MLYSIKIALISFSFILLSSCDSSTFISSGPSLNGIVVDGYIHDATVCLDLNNNDSCEDTEPTSKTDENGVFNFSNSDLGEDSLVQVIASGGTDTSTAKEFQGLLRNIVETTSLTQESVLILSPLTDLVTMSFLNSSSKDSLALSDAKSTVSAAIDIEEEIIDKDPMQDIALFAKSQEIQQTKLLILTAITTNLEENLSLTNELLLKEYIKEELVSNNLDIRRVFIAIDLKLNASTPIVSSNEQTFVISQIEELKTTLNTFSKDPTLNIEELDRLQLFIDNEQEEANDILITSEDNTTFEIVEINKTKESITQSNFDTTFAILDKQACKTTDGYISLKNDALAPQTSEDEENGIIIKSEYTFSGDVKNSEVEIFYPNLDQIKTGTSILVFQDGYYFAFDKSWTTNSKRTVYVMTPSQEDSQSSSCYRFELNFSSTTTIEGTKVYSYTDI